MKLVGDIGGTNTRLALFDNGKMLDVEKKFSSQKYKSLEDVIVEFLQGKKVDTASFGIAGPIRNRQSKVTNLPWLIDARRISQKLHIRTVHLLNDLEANAYGIKVLKKEDQFVLHEGVKQEGNQALIAAGTGLGEAALFWDGTRHRPFASEGGHTDFSPRNAEEIELFLYLQKKYGSVSFERVISGPGLKNVFQFLIDTGREVLSEEVKAEMEINDHSRVISEWGCKEKDAACVHAVEWFVSMYGAEAGNMALKYLSLGGFYVGGGIAPHVVEKIKMGGFHSSFVGKGRLRELLESIPIYIILNDHTALLGAAIYGDNE